MKKLAMAAAAVLCLTLPAVAHARDGYMTCQLFESGKNRVVYTHPFEADSADADAIYEQFLASVQDQGYVSDFSGVSGICNWEADEDTAAEKTENYKSHYEENGARVIGVPFSPS